jgi:signal transduction histidine kinase
MNKPIEGRKHELKKSFRTSVVAGAAFGLVIGIVFLLLNVVDFQPLPFLGSLIVVTSLASGLAGLGGAFLDIQLEHWGLTNPALRSLVNFLVVASLTFGTAVLIVSRSGWLDVAQGLQNYALPGMFLGLVFGVLVAAISYRLDRVQQRVRLLEMENRYLTDMAEKDQLLQEAARNLAVAEERNSMARELHDSISQGIHGIVFSLHSLRRQLGQGCEAEEILGHLEQTTQATLQEMRRLITELSPSPLENNSLEEALELHCELFSLRQQIPVELSLQYGGQLAPEQEAAIYRIVQEALANIQQHAGARHVEIALSDETERTVLRIQDDGCGFQPETAARGYGLTNMATRARQNYGEFQIRSQHGQGTVVDVVFTPHSM